VRISGPDAAAIATVLIGKVPAARQAVHAIFRDANGNPLDEGIALHFPAPHSYTGEDVLELQGHGGPVVTQAVLAAAIDALAEGLTELRALTEAVLDFPEDEVDPLHRTDAQARLARLSAALEEVLGKSRQGSLLRNGVHVVLVGRPNVGKSSLMNRLAGEERAIVTPQPGTTRDALRETLQIDGVPIVLVDTAGLHASRDEIERIGMERTRREMAHADLVVTVLEAPGLQPPEAPPKGVAQLRVINKIDLE